MNVLKYIVKRVKKRNAALTLEQKAAIDKRHVWLWKIESENDVVHAWLLQWEERGMEIIDKYFLSKDEAKAFRAFNRKIKEITREVMIIE